MEVVNIPGGGVMTIGSAERPFHVGLRQGAILSKLPHYVAQTGAPLTLAAYNEKFNLDALRLLQFDFDDYGNFVYSALAAGALMQKQPVDFTPDEVLSWMNEADEREVVKVFKEMTNQALARVQAQLERLKNAAAPNLATETGQALS